MSLAPIPAAFRFRSVSLIRFRRLGDFLKKFFQVLCERLELLFELTVFRHQLLTCERIVVRCVSWRDDEGHPDKGRVSPSNLRRKCEFPCKNIQVEPIRDGMGLSTSSLAPVSDMFLTIASMIDLRSLKTIFAMKNVLAPVGILVFGHRRAPAISRVTNDLAVPENRVQVSVCGAKGHGWSDVVEIRCCIGIVGDGLAVRIVASDVANLVVPNVLLRACGAAGARQQGQSDHFPEMLQCRSSRSSVPVATLFWVFLSSSGSNVSLALFVPALTAVTAIFAVLMATACGYLAGLLGSSSSPISGIAILTVMLVIGCSLAVLPSATPEDARFVGALSLFVTSIIITASSIANDNLQDLKSGHIVGATPWKQQVALAIGVALGAITIAPVLQLLYDAYGFVGALPRSGMDPSRAMPAPQAALLAQVADGIVNYRLDWKMVAIGAGLGIVFVALESALRRRNFTLPALSVGIGIYLPCAIVLTIAAGGVVGWLAERAASSPEAQEALRRRGVLLSSGFLVGESLVGILVALADVLQGKSGALAIYEGDGFATRSMLSLLLFTILISAFYRLISRRRPLRPAKGPVEIS